VLSTRCRLYIRHTYLVSKYCYLTILGCAHGRAVYTATLLHTYFSPYLGHAFDSWKKKLSFHGRSVFYIFMRSLFFGPVVSLKACDEVCAEFPTQCSVLGANLEHAKTFEALAQVSFNSVTDIRNTNDIRLVLNVISC